MTPGTVTEVSATLVATMIRRRAPAACEARDPARPRRAIRAAAASSASRPRRRGHCISSIARRISNAPGRKHSTSPLSCGASASATASATDAPGAYDTSSGYSRPGHVDDRTAAEKRGHGRGVERRRHDDDPEVVAGAPGLLRKRDGEIGVNAALVELVEHDGPEIREQRILLQPRRQHAFGRDEQLRSRTESALEADLPADLLADRPPAFRRDALRDGARGHAARLQQDQRAVVDEAPEGREWFCRRRAAPVTTTARDRRTCSTISGMNRVDRKRLDRDVSRDW